MIGVVLAAGRGSRLGESAVGIPKALVSVDDQRTILDVTLRNFSQVGISETVVVGGHRIERLMREVPRLEERHGVSLTVLANPYYETWNNCFSLLCARQWFGQQILLANGDTLHHGSIDRRLVDDASDSEILLAVDHSPGLGEEEMKVAVDDRGRVTELSKEMDPSLACGEYIGVALIRPRAGDRLVAALREVVERDPGLYYEDGFTSYARSGGTVTVMGVGEAPWSEVDTEHDLAQARSMACLC